MKRKPELTGSDAGNGVPEIGTPGEAKRLAARRRFLLGGAAAVPLIVTLGQREAWAASSAVCSSLGMGFDWRYAKNNQNKNSDGSGGKFGVHKQGGWQWSAYCDPNRRWS